LVQLVTIDDRPHGFLPQIRLVTAEAIESGPNVARQDAYGRGWRAIPTLLVVCCVSAGQVRKRAGGWRLFIANVEDSSEYQIMSHHSKAVTQVVPFISRAELKSDRFYSKSNSCPL
jgi:hypothetical protein